jgi:hypothetical protein
MRKSFLYPFLLLIFLSNSANAQRHELGANIGMSNLVGDIGRTNYMLQMPIDGQFSVFGAPFYAGILYRWNFNPYQTIRLNLGYNHIQFADGVADEYYRRNRQLFGTNSMYEANIVFEYNFLPANDEQKSLLSPYVFGGFGGLFMESSEMTGVVHDFRRNANGTAIAPTDFNDFVSYPTFAKGNKMTMEIPFGIGLKYKFNYNWAVFGEFMFRATFSDAVDYSEVDVSNVNVTYNSDILAPGSSTSLLQTDQYQIIADFRTQALIEQRKVGNPNSKDWVNTFSIGLTYSFGRPPCYCK